MKKFYLFPLLLLSLAVSTTHAAVKEIDSIVAVVDDDIITRFELNDRLQSLVAQLQQNRRQLPPLAVLQRQLLERLIIEKLQLAQAKQLGIQIGDEELRQYVLYLQNERKLLQQQLPGRPKRSEVFV